MNIIPPRKPREYVQLFLRLIVTFLFIAAFALALKKFTIENLELEILGIAVFGSTVFLALVSTDTAMAQSHRIFFSYIFAIIIGIGISYLVHNVIHCSDLGCTKNNILVFSAATAGILCFFLMSLFSCEHPPAIGLAIGLSIQHQSWDYHTTIVIMVGIICLLIVKQILKKFFALNLVKG